MPYVIVEFAGYERETECGEFPTLREAIEYERKHYDPDEIDTLHVAIAKRLPDGSLTYEF